MRFELINMPMSFDCRIASWYIWKKGLGAFEKK